MNFNDLKIEDQAIIIKASRSTCRNCLTTKKERGPYCCTKCREEYLSLPVRIETQSQWNSTKEKHIIFMELRQIQNNKIIERFTVADYKKDPTPKDFNQLFKQLQLAWRSINKKTKTVRKRRYGKI